MNSVRTPKLWLAVLAAAALALTGCSANVSLGGSSVSQSDLEEESSKQLANDPANPPQVRCDGSLDNKVDATQKCQVQIDGRWVDYTATVTSVDGDNVKFDIRADNPADVSPTATPESGADQGAGPEAKTELEQNLSQSIQEQTGSAPDDVRCAGPLDATVGATQECALQDRDRWLPITVTVTGVQGDDIAFDWAIGRGEIPEPSY